MAIASEIQPDPDDAGGAVVVRRATGADDAARLRQIGERLEAIGHPGVVQVRSSSGDDEAWELQLDYAGRPLEQLATMPAEQVAGLAAAVAATLADLHGAGVVHGRLDASHVLVGPEGRPILCGIDAHSDPPPAPHDDVAALGALMVTLLDPSSAGPDLEPIPDRRWRRRRSWDGWVRRSLLLLADQACAEPATRRPTARRLAAAITEAVPDAAAVDPGGRGPARDQPFEPTDLPEPDPFATLRLAAEPPADRARWSALAGAAAAVVVLALVGTGAARGFWPAQGAGGAPSTAPPTTTQPTTTITQPTTTITQPTTAPSTTGTSMAARSPAVEVPVVGFGPREYRVGQAGDRVAVGDWDGDGEPTPAVLRPSTGEVFVFTSWPDGSPITVRPTTSVPDGVELVAEPAGARDSLVVRRVDGSRTIVEVTS